MKGAAFTHIIHTIPPVYDKASRVLILGTIPSPASRKAGFYYGHPQNRFWKILEAVYGESCGASPAEKTAFLLKHRAALWDVLAECDITGASDSSIKNPVPNDFAPLFAAAAIEKVFTTGQRAFALYRRLCAPRYDVPYSALPSPSPANCAIPFGKLAAAYREALL